MISPEESTKDNIVFTEYYAGSYLDQDENLVICFTKSLESSDKYNDSIIYLLKNFKSAEIVDQIKKLDNIDFSMMKSSALNNITYKEDLSDLKNVLYMDNLKSYIRFKTVEYSYNKIYRTQVIIEEKFKEYADLYSNEKTKEHELINSIAAISINLGQGLDIYIVDLNNDKINTFYSLFGNYKFLNFYNSENEDNLINSQRTYF
jgi:hypothetical protein